MDIVINAATLKLAKERRDAQPGRWLTVATCFVAMEIFSQLIGLAKGSGLSLVLVVGACLFGYKKVWPWWCAYIERRDAAREAHDNRFLDSLTAMQTAGQEALERRDRIQRESAAVNAAAVDRNTDALREITRSVADLKK